MRPKTLAILSLLLIAFVLIITGIQESLRQAPTSSIREYALPETSSQKIGSESASKSDAMAENPNQEESLQKEGQTAEKEATEKELDEAVAPLEARDALSSTGNPQTDGSAQTATKPGDEQTAQPAPDDMMRTVTIGGKEYQVKVGESITATRQTRGTWNPRPLTEAERQKLIDYGRRLERGELSMPEIMEMQKEILRLAEEASYPGVATTTVRIVKNKDK